MSKTSVIIIIITQNLRFGEDIQDMTTNVMVTLVCSVCGNRTGLYFQGFASFFSLGTKEALAAKKAQGVVLGKPKGTI
ncbi:MAG: hypothetical protein MUO54_08460 [Anaerolineales bacterium]|nr:hypothetical protein [Anaerolineales bacterium]